MRVYDFLRISNTRDMGMRRSCRRWRKRWAVQLRRAARLGLVSVRAGGRVSAWNSPPPSAIQAVAVDAKVKVPAKVKPPRAVAPEPVAAPPAILASVARSAAYVDMPPSARHSTRSRSCQRRPGSIRHGGLRAPQPCRSQANRPRGSGQRETTTRARVAHALRCADLQRNGSLRLCRSAASGSRCRSTSRTALA